MSVLKKPKVIVGTVIVLAVANISMVMPRLLVCLNDIT